MQKLTIKCPEESKKHHILAQDNITVRNRIRRQVTYSVLKQTNDKRISCLYHYVLYHYEVFALFHITMTRTSSLNLLAANIQPQHLKVYFNDWNKSRLSLKGKRLRKLRSLNRYHLGCPFTFYSCISTHAFRYHIHLTFQVLKYMYHSASQCKLGKICQQLIQLGKMGKSYF